MNEWWWEVWRAECADVAPPELMWIRESRGWCNYPIRGWVQGALWIAWTCEPGHKCLGTKWCCYSLITVCLVTHLVVSLHKSDSSHLNPGYIPWLWTNYWHHLKSLSACSQSEIASNYLYPGQISIVKSCSYLLMSSYSQRAAWSSKCVLRWWG